MKNINAFMAMTTLGSVNGLVTIAATSAPQLAVVDSSSGSCVPNGGTVPSCAAGTLGIAAGITAVNPANGDVAIVNTADNYIYLVAGSAETEFGISMTAGSAYLVAGDGATNGAPNFTTHSAFGPVGPGAIAFDASGNLVLADNAGPASVDVIAAASGTAYGQAVTAGGIYKLAGAGAQTAPVASLPGTVGQLAGQFLSLAVSPAGNIVVSLRSYGIVLINEGTAASTAYGQTVAADSAAFVAGSLTGSAANLANAQPATASLVQGAFIALDLAGNVVFTAQSTTANSADDTIWALPAASGTAYGQTVAAGDIYLVAGTKGTSDPENLSAVPALSAVFASASAVAVDSAGNILVGDNGQNYSLAVIAENANPAYGVADWTPGDVYTLSGGAAATTASAPAPASTFELPPVVSVGFATAGDIFVNGWNILMVSSAVYEITNANPLAAGTPKANICVYMYPAPPTGGPAAYSSCTITGTFTNPASQLVNYEISGVASGTYDVAFADPTNYYATQWWDTANEPGGSPSIANATTVSVSGGNTETNGVNALMGVTSVATVSGTVYEAHGTTPLAGACAYLYSGSNPTSSFDACTANDGTYTIYGVAAGTYDVAFSDPAAGYTTQWWTGTTDIHGNPVGSPTQAGASAAVVPTSSTITGINADLALVPVGAVSGTITMGANTPTPDAPLPNACAYLYTATNAASASFASCSVADGTYNIYGVTPGQYYVEFALPGVSSGTGTGSDTGYATQWYTGAGTTPATITVGNANAVTTGINAALSLAGVGGVSGTVKDASTLLGINGACVYLYTAAEWNNGNIDAPASYQACTGTTPSATPGAYEITGVTDGTYYVVFAGPSGSGYISEWYNSGGQTTLANGAGTISVTGNVITPNISATLPQV